MKKGWEIKKLGDICKIRTGKKDVNQGNPDGKYPFFTCAREHTFSDGYSFDDEALLIAGNGDVGSVSYYKGKFEAYQRTYVLTGFSDILPNFLFYILDGFLKQKMSAQKLGNTMPYIKLGMLAEFEIPLPPLSEQKRIISILDKLFADIEKAKSNAKQNLKNTKEIFESYLENILENNNWEIKKLEEFYEITSSKRVFKSEWKSEGVPFYRAREIVKLAKQGFVKNDLFISEDMYNQYSKKYGIPKENDIMITGVGTLGICYVVKKDDKFYFKDGNIIWLKTKNNINSRFIEYAFKSNFIKKQINDGLGAVVGTFTIIKANNTRLPIPSIAEQKSIVKKLDDLSKETKKLEDVYKNKITELEELKKSILQKAFNGYL